MANPKFARSLSSPKRRPEAAENTRHPINRGDARFGHPSRVAGTKFDHWSKEREAHAENHAILVV